jgi:hypothetical protein
MDRATLNAPPDHDRDLSRLVGLRLVLGVLCLYHLGVGVATVLTPAAVVEYVGGFYGITAHADAQFVYMLKALGMYACFTGGLLGVAFMRPYRHRVVVYMVIGLLCMRALTRLACYDVLHEAFGVAWEQNLINVGLLVLQAGVLFWAIGLATKAAELSHSATRSAVAHVTTNHLQPLRDVLAHPEPAPASRLAAASARLSQHLTSARQPRFDACASGVV